MEGEDAPTIRSLQAEQVNVHHIISEVSTKIDAVQFQNVILCSQIKATSESFTKISKTKPSTLTELLADIQLKMNWPIESIEKLMF